MNSVRLHRQLVQSLAAIGVGASQPQRTNLAGLSQALAFSANCHLATLALGLPFAGQRENLIQRLRRFLKTRWPATAGVLWPAGAAPAWPIGRRGKSRWSWTAPTSRIA